VRELTEILWASLRESHGSVLLQPRALDEIRAALARHGGNQSKVHLDLGLSRYALRRLLKKYGPGGGSGAAL